MDFEANMQNDKNESLNDSPVNADNYDKSNVKLEQLGFMEQLDRNVLVVSTEENLDVDGIIYVCVTQESMLNIVNELEAKSDESCVYAQLPLGMLINSAIKNENVRAMVINGLASIPLVIVKEDLLPIKDWVESFCIMYSVVKHGMPNKRAYELLKNKIVYILGTLPRPDMKKGETFGYEVVKREVEGEEYESIKCFLTPESARKYNKNNKPVTPVMVQVLHDFFGNVIIEPHRNYWVEFKDTDWHKIEI